MKINNIFSDIYIDAVLYSIALVYILASFRYSVVNIVVFGLVLVSLVFWLISRFQLGDSFSVLPEARKIVTKGIYSKISHPIYLFTGLANIGIIYLLQNKYLYFLIPIFIVIQYSRSKNEEKALIKKFGKYYIEYKKDTLI